MEMIEIDYSKVREFEEERIRRNVAGFRFLPYCHFILALRELGWNHRDIVAFMYQNFEDLKPKEGEKHITNIDLSKFIFAWKNKGLIDAAAIKYELANIQQSLKTVI